MSRIDYDLTKIRGFVFDVDGVLSPSTIPMGYDGRPMRMANIKDGYALQLAIRFGYRIALITGGYSEAIRNRFGDLNITDVYMRVAEKVPVLQNWMRMNNFSFEEVVYVGDDIPDSKCMQLVGLSVAPKDAATEIKEMATYVSPFDGGYGVARDVIEQVLRAKGVWNNSEKAFGW